MIVACLGLLHLRLPQLSRHMSRMKSADAYYSHERTERPPFGNATASAGSSALRRVGHVHLRQYRRLHTYAAGPANNCLQKMFTGIMCLKNILV